MEAPVPSPQTTLLILLGASEWPLFHEFQDSEAFANAARELKAYFLDPKRFGVSPENILDVFNSNNSPDEQDAQIGQFLERRLAAMKATGHASRDLLVYFVGHGGFVGRDSDFYLAIRRTRMENPRASGIPMLSLADTLTEKARYLRRIIILDCCFAAAAFSAFQAGPAQVAIEKTKDAFEVKQRGAGFPAKGTTLLCSSSQRAPSLLLPDGSSTMFTKALLDALAEGLPPQRERLSLREVKDIAAGFLSETRNAPRPVVLSPDQSEGDVADIPFFPNPRAEEERARQAEEERSRLAEEAERTRRMEEERLQKAEEERARQAEEERQGQVEEAEQNRKIAESLPQVITTPSPDSPLSSSQTVEPLHPEPPIREQKPLIVGQTGSALPPQAVKRTANFFTIGGIFLLLMILIGGGILFTTHNRNPSTSSNINAPTGGKDCTKVGVLLPDTAISRWVSLDKPLLTQDIQALPGVRVDYYNAQGHATTQQTQANTALAQGDCILVVAANDPIAAAAIVTSAKAKNVPVIAYDRLIQSDDLNYYVSVDNLKVGELQGQYIVDHYQAFTQGGNNVVMIDGSQTDNSALLFRQGTLSKIQPLFDNGTLKKVYEHYTPNWDNATAQTEMQAALTANQNNVQIAYVANDGMANSVIAALKATKLNRKVLVTGQDATVAGIQNILIGNQAMTVYKPPKEEAQAVADLVKALHDGTDTASITNSATVKTGDGTTIPSVLATPIAIDKTNIRSTVIADGFVTVSEICSGLPPGTGGICP